MDKEARKKYNREYYLKRKEEDPDYVKKQYARLKADSERYAKMLERSRIRHRKIYAEHRPYYYRREQKRREALIEFLGGRCVRCGYSEDIRALQLDHKNGDGTQDREKFGSYIARYYCKHLDEAKEKLQVLCANCNKIKAAEENEYYKKKRITPITSETFAV